MCCRDRGFGLDMLGKWRTGAGRVSVSDPTYHYHGAGQEARAE